MDTMRRYSMLIDGDWVDTVDRFEIRSPATEELVASVAKGDRELADRAVAAAKAAHEAGLWRRTPPAQRAAVLDAIAQRLTERMDELAVLQVLENGTTLRQAGAFHLGFSIATCGTSLNWPAAATLSVPDRCKESRRWPAASCAVSPSALVRPSCRGISRCC
jgi:acyl-CoA reductase-like NAD-dependent aldehyde dehydrogenase